MTPLYQRVLAASWQDLPPEIRAMHDGVTCAEGVADVERGRNPLAWVAAQVLGFPANAVATPLRVEFTADEGGETWTRTFGRKRLVSRQHEGKGGVLCERFGTMEFAIELELRDTELWLVLRGWRVWGVPLPLWIGPRSRTYESAENGRFRFFVEISHPLCGLIVRYQGWLTPQPPPGPRV